MGQAKEAEIRRMDAERARNDREENERLAVVGWDEEIDSLTTPED